ncbi:hypothetical protein C8R45DRAFT_1209516 [Mycena sanguinolenta]|nr:hypothetical protein C8R45DRAFT_1209516 [Mycena sanguinolenta]
MRDYGDHESSTMPLRARAQERAFNSAPDFRDICAGLLSLLTWELQFCIVLRAFPVSCSSVTVLRSVATRLLVYGAESSTQQHATRPHPALQRALAKARPQSLMYQLQYFRLPLAATPSSALITQCVVAPRYVLKFRIGR